MKINGTIFSKPQQDQLKRAIENSGDGGMTLNEYEYSIKKLDNITNNDILRLNKIFCLAKNIQNIYLSGFEWSSIVWLYYQQGTPNSTASDSVVLRFNSVYCYNSFTHEELTLSTTSSPKAVLKETKFTNGVFVTTDLTKKSFRVTYLNDTEIT